MKEKGVLTEKMKNVFVTPANKENETLAICENISSAIPEVSCLYPIINSFSDNEMQYIYPQSIRGSRIFIVGAINNLVNEKLMQLAVDAARSARASEIIPLITYLGYARQDIRDSNRSCLGVKVLIKALEVQGATSAITLDLHNPHVIGYFDIPIDHIDGFYIFREALLAYIHQLGHGDKKLGFISPDGGGIKRVSWTIEKVLQMNVFNKIDVTQVHCNKWRDKPDSISRMELVGNVKDKHIIAIDDIADTCNTIIKCSEIVMNAGARSFSSMVTHAVMSNQQYSELVISKGKINKFYLSNSIPSYRPLQKNIIVVDITPVLVKVIRAIIDNKSVNNALDHN